MGCASLFVVAGLAWPFLHLIGGTLEPEAMFVPVVIGGPAFLVAHILALIALRTGAPETAARGRRALCIMWGGLAILVLFGLLTWLVDWVRGRV
jgi:hypothetical protein